MNNLKTILCGIAMLSLSISSFATHMAGGDLTYRCIGGNQYEITYSFYRDCAGISAPTSVNVGLYSASCGISTSITLFNTRVDEITTPCATTTTTCRGGSQPGIQKWTYRNTVSLAACRDWVFSFSDCCRNYAITNLNSPGSNSLYVEARLNNRDFPCNSSPQFTNDPVLFVCVNQRFIYNHGVVDADGDILTYSLVNPLQGPSSTVTYNPPFSATNPLSSNPPLALNSSTGDITMTPTALQITVMAVRVDEYRGGQLVGSVIRDMQVYVSSCNNVLPTASGVNGTSDYSITIRAGQTTCFDIFTNDANAGDVVSITWNGGIPPPAFFGQHGGPFAIGTFCWTPTNADISPLPYIFTVTVRDNACPSNGVQVYSYSVYVERGCEPLRLVTSATDMSCNGVCDGTMSVAVTGQVLDPPFTYLWDNGETTPTITGLCQGSQFVTVTDARGCTETAHALVNEPTQMFITTQSFDSRCVASQNGVGQAFVGGGTPPYTYLWSNGDTSAQADNLAIGVYTVTVTDARGCSVTGTVGISFAFEVGSYITSSHVTCRGAGDGIATAFVFTNPGSAILTGSAVLEFRWSTGDTTAQITNLTPGCYEVTVSDTFGCSDSSSVCILEAPSELTFTTSSTPSACGSPCNGTAGVALSGGVPPYSFLWDNGAPSPFLTRLCPGIHNVTASDSYNCTLEVTVNVGGPPPIITTLNVAVCEGGGVFAGGAFQTEPGTYYDTLTAANGCDSIIITVLTIQDLVITSDAHICEGDSFFAGGAFQTASGTYIDTFFNQGGCDTVVQITNLTVHLPDFITADISICDGNSYFAGGASQTTPGTYIDTFASRYGCDSVVTTNLSVLPHSQLTLNVTICDGDTYFAGGASQTTPGTYYDTLVSANGCDSVVITHLSVLPNSETVINADICDGDGYFAAGTFQTTTGTYYDTLQAVNGCDSVVITNLTVHPNVVTTVDVTICNEDTYFAGGANQNTSGTYVDSLLTRFGCDSILITNLTVRPVPNVVVFDVSVCEGDSILVGGLWRTQDGIYQDTFSTQNGCDSVILINLFTIPIDRDTTDAVICEGESYFAGGTLQTTSGTYIDTLEAFNGCDSILVTYLTVLPSPRTMIDATICGNEFYFAGGGFQNTSGTYYDTLTAANGCDSVVITNLTVNPTAQMTFNVTICSNEFYFAGGGFQNTPGTYIDSFLTSLGCDSLVITILDVLPASSIVFDVTVCSGSGYFAGGAFQTVSGTYYDSLLSANGCDSIIVTSLTVLPPLETVMDVQICTGSSYFAGGAFQTTSGTYYDTLVTSLGCDSVIITNLSVLAVLETTVDVQICDGTGYFAGGAFQTSSGTFYDTLVTAAGCDSVIITNLTVSSAMSLSFSISEVQCAGACDGSIICNAAGGQQPLTFNWSDGQSSQQAIGLCAGTYAITVTDFNGCSVTEDNIAVGEPSPLTATATARGNSCNCANLQCCDGFASCEPAGGTPPYSFQWSNGSSQQNLNNACPGSYDVTVTDAKGCQFITSATVSEFNNIEITMTFQDLSPGCSASNVPAELNFSDLPAGTILNEQFAARGIHISGDAYGVYPDVVIVFDADATGTPDPDLETAAGGLAIFPERISDNNGDGRVDVPNDQGSGGVMTFIFDQPMTIASFVFVDRDNNNPATAKAYDGDNQLIKSVNIPNRGNGSIQTVTVNASGVRRFVLDYRDSGGLLKITFGPGAQPSCCDGAASAAVTGGTPPYVYQWSNGENTPSISSLCPGTYTVTVTDADGCTAARSVAIDDCRLSITGMTIVRHRQGGDVAPLTDGITISLDTLCPFNIRAELCTSPVGSVRFRLNGVNFRVEEQAPYALAGDNPSTGNYYAWIPAPGDYTIEATPYAGRNATGAAGRTFTVHLTVTGTPCNSRLTWADEIFNPEFELAAYPVPFGEHVAVDLLAATAGRGSLKVKDVLGKELISQDIHVAGGRNTFTIATNGLMSKAVYILEVRIDSGVKILMLMKAE